MLILVKGSATFGQGKTCTNDDFFHCKCHHSFRKNESLVGPKCYSVSNVHCIRLSNRHIRDLWYGEAVVQPVAQQQIVKITSDGIMARVPLRLSRCSLAFYYGKVPSFTYSSLREYKPAVYFSF